MKKKAFTLIELMIVIALLGIIAGSMFEPIRVLYSDIKKSEEEFFQQDRLARAFSILKQAFEKSESLETWGDNSVILNGSGKKLTRAEDGRKLVFENNSGGKIELHFSPGTRIGNFFVPEKHTLNFQISMNGAKFPMYFRTGK